MRKKYLIIIITMTLLGLFVVNGIVKVKRIVSTGKFIINTVNIVKKDYLPEINDLKRNNILPQYIKDMLGKMLFFV